MWIISRKKLRNCWVMHPQSEAPLKEWFNITEKANWQNPKDVTDAISYSRYIKNNRFIFNIKGNDFRLVVYINFPAHKVFIKFAGTHDEYDKIDPETI